MKTLAITLLILQILSKDSVEKEVNIKLPENLRLRIVGAKLFNFDIGIDIVMLESIDRLLIKDYLSSTCILI
jgi:hypothetical protein